MPPAAPPSSPVAPAPRARPRGRALLLGLALLVASLLAVEGLYRVVLRARGIPWNRAAATEEVRQRVSSLTRSVPSPEAAPVEPTADPEGRLREQLHPYFGFDAPAILEDAVTAELAYFATPASHEALDVLILGGSVSARFHDFGGPTLIEGLRADPRFAEREIRLLRHGRGSYKQPQQVMVVTYLLSLGYRPDVVINIDGFNEVALALENGLQGVHPLQPSLPRWGHLVTGKRLDPEGVQILWDARRAQLGASALGSWALEHGLLHSAVVGRAVLRRLNAMQGASARAHARLLGRLGGTSDPALAGPPHARETDAILGTAVEGWVESSRTLHALCAARGAHYLHVLQPTLHDEGSKPLTEREVATSGAAQSWIDGARLGYPLLRAAAGRLRAAGVDFLDASGVFADQRGSLYFDVCHFRPAGHHTLARAIAAALLEGLPR